MGTPSVVKHPLLDEICRQTPAAMAIWRGPDLKLEFVNPVYCSFFPDRPLLGLRPLEAFPELADQPLPGLLARVFETGEPHEGREFLVHHRRAGNGPIEDHYYDFAYRRIDGPDGKPYGVYDFAIDVTDRVRARLALMHKQAELERANEQLRIERETRDLFVALLTHDLRTPLNVAKMSAHLASLKSERPQDVIAHSSKALEAIDRIDKMVRDLLDTSRIRAGAGLEIRVTAGDLVPLVRGVCDESTALYGASFEIRAPERLAGHWSCPEIRRAIENLASNAAKHGDIKRPICVAIERVGDDVEVAVHNDGPPIPSQDLPQLFESFRRSSNAGSGAKGWGLGLSLVRGVAQAHGGAVRVESSMEAGTTFTLRIPVDCRSAR